jgi:hypothetical protein
MPEKETSGSFAFSNPVKGATAGLVVSACTALGAKIIGHDVHQEALTTLVGGVIVGAIAGSFGCCVPNPDGFSCSGKFAIYLLQTAIGNAVTCAAPVMGEAILGLGSNYSDTVIDTYVGSGVLTGGLLGVAGVVGGIAYGAYSLFSEKENTPEMSVNPLAGPQNV